MNTALAANTGDGIHQKTPFRRRPALLEIATGNVLWHLSQPGHLERPPRSGATMISFSNSGQRPCFHQLHLPAQALEFIGAILAAGVRSTFLDWAQETRKWKRRAELKGWLDELCNDVEERRSIGPLLFRLVRSRENHRLRKEERKVLEIYEDVALEKKVRFDALQRVADKIHQMPIRYSESFIKQLGNLGSKRTLLDLLRDFCKRRGLKLTPAEVWAIHESPASEAASLLYLLCVAEDKEETNDCSDELVNSRGSSPFQPRTVSGR